MVGGQAVLEGVMMRGPGNWAVAVRTPSGEIAQVSKSIDSAMARHRVFRLPVVRGVIALGESLAIGFRALAPTTQRRRRPRRARTPPRSRPSFRAVRSSLRSRSRSDLL
jgi:uncharacterized protein YqhQ